MWARRENVSLLMSEGHAHARRYPIGMLLDECRIASRRINNRIASEMSLTHLAVSAILSKKGGTEFRKAVQRLQES